MKTHRQRGLGEIVKAYQSSLGWVVVSRFRDGKVDDGCLGSLPK